MPSSSSLPKVPFHSFHAAAFVENLSLKELATSFGEARRGLRELQLSLPGGGEAFIYPFGAVVFHNVAPRDRETEMARIHKVRPGLTTAAVAAEEFNVQEDPAAKPDVANGVLTIDQLTPDRAGIVALIVAQSVAMEYYETITENMFDRTRTLVERLMRKGTVPMSFVPMHKFIGTAVDTRNEVLSVLHLLDKPDAAWDDPLMDKIYDELRAEFDLVDRYEAMSAKLRAIQEGLELILDVARDRRLVMLDATIVALIVLEIVMALLKIHG